MYENLIAASNGPVSSLSIGIFFTNFFMYFFRQISFETKGLYKKISPLLSNEPEVIDFDNGSNKLFNSINLIKDRIQFECFF